jgi:hypothetical protein
MKKLETVRNQFLETEVRNQFFENHDASKQAL